MENPAPDTPASTPEPGDDAPAPASTFTPYDWDQARADFLAGEPAIVVAARLQVSERTVQRRAAQESWRRCDRRRAVVEPPLDPTLSPITPLGDLMLATEIEGRELMDDADPRRSIRYAWTRTNEAALRGRPSEALAWVRLIELLNRVEIPIRIAANLPSDADMMRAISREAHYARRAGQVEEMAGLFLDPPDDEDDSQDDDA